MANADESVSSLTGSPAFAIPCHDLPRDHGMAAARDCREGGGGGGTHLESHVGGEEEIVIIDHHNNIDSAASALPSPLTHAVI